MDRPVSIESSKFSTVFKYDEIGNRLKMNVSKIISGKKNNYYEKVYFSDKYELDNNANAYFSEWIYLYGDAYSAPAMYAKRNNSWDIYYIVRDYLGSTNQIVTKNGSVLQDLRYNAWGRIGEYDREYYLYPIGEEPKLLTGRGYTGHEHLQEYGLINMNARLYDPYIGRFLSPDPFVQMPDFSQNYNRYTYALNNPLRYTDPNGEFLHLVIGAAIGGTMNWAVNGFQFNARGLAAFGVGALSGALSAGIGAGVNVAMAGGSFSAGFLSGTSTVSSIGFFSGVATGASAGFSNGMISGFGNGLLDGSGFGNSLLSGLGDGLKQGITGGVFSGIRSYEKGLNFFTGKGTFDISNGVGCHSPIKEKISKVTGAKFVGAYNGVDVYETAQMDGRAVTLPEAGIIVNPGDYSAGLDMDLIKHEFGHYLQAEDIGKIVFYREIAPASILSASRDGIGGHSHNSFWTETWANYLSHNYHGGDWNTSRFPIKNISSTLYKYLKMKGEFPYYLLPF